MKITVNKTMFKELFKSYGRENDFSDAGLSALFEYCEDFFGEEWELDVIALCCDFTESDIDEIANDNGIDLSDCVELEDQFDAVIDFINRETVVIYSDEDTGTILYENF